MEKILLGIIKSDHPIPVKKAVAAQISNAAKVNSDDDVCKKILETCLSILVESSTDLTVEIVSTVLKSWICHHVATVTEYINENILLKKVADDSERIVTLKNILWCLKTLSSIPNFSKSSLKSYLFNSFLTCDILELLALHCEVYIRYPMLIPEQLDFESKIEVTKVIVTVVSTTPYVFQAPTMEGSSSSLIHQHLDTIFKLLSLYITCDTKLMKYTAAYLFKVLSNTDKHPSISLARFLPSLQLDFLEQDIEEIMMVTVSSETLSATLAHMIDWICFPDANLGIDEWVIKFMKYLVKYRKFESFFSVVESKIKQICNLMFFPVMRKAAVPVLTFMLISHLHSPSPFHQVSLIFPRLLEHLQKSPETKQTCQVLVELIHTLMFHFPGYPDIYSPLLTAVKGYSKPTEAAMKTWLNASFSIPRIEHSNFIMQQNKSDTGKIGLENLGNTCYMNSVIQALFNLPCIKSEVVTKTYSPATQCISTHLQRLFALLYASERPAIAPKDFCKVSRPSWFVEGSQQDCSEYLKHLLDKVQQESSEVSEKLNEYCTGELNATVVCSNCRFSSSRKETFNDLPLSFQAASAEASSSGVCTLKGGDSSERIERKVHIDVATTETQEVNMEFSQEPSVSISADVSMTSQDEHVTLVDMMNSYFLPEELYDTNKYFCEKCAELQNARKYMEIEKFPKYLVLTLKRFTYNTQTQKRNKILKSVEYPMRFSSCIGCESCTHEIKTVGDEALEKSCNDNQGRLRRSFTTSITCQGSDRYRLKSVIVHSGFSSDNGHYYCYACEYTGDNTYNWYLMNDSRISRAPVDFLINLGSTFPRDTPYVCIYEKHVDVDDPIPGLPPALQDLVMVDNQKYMEEIKSESRKKENVFKFPRRPTEDDDDTFGGSNGSSCGGSFGGAGFSGSKFVC